MFAAHFVLKLVNLRKHSAFFSQGPLWPLGILPFLSTGPILPCFKTWRTSVLAVFYIILALLCGKSSLHPHSMDSSIQAKLRSSAKLRKSKKKKSKDRLKGLKQSMLNRVSCWPAVLLLRAVQRGIQELCFLPKRDTGSELVPDLTPFLASVCPAFARKYHINFTDGTKQIQGF